MLAMPTSGAPRRGRSHASPPAVKRKGTYSCTGAVGSSQPSRRESSRAHSTRAWTCSEVSPARHNSDHGYRDGGATNGRHTIPGTVGTHEDGAQSTHRPATTRSTDARMLSTVPRYRVG